MTRFNLPSAGAESLIRAKEGWLRSRVDLFERYCLPSVRAQRNQNFRWIVYFDPESPQWLHERITAHTDAGGYVPLYRTKVEPADLVADLRNLITAPGDVLITTNLDNDDGLAVDFTDRLQRISTHHERAAVYLANGLIKSPSAVYFRNDPHNAFCSVRENWSAPRTCWADWHNLLGTTMPTLEIGGAPAWLQVIHGANVSNRVRGRLVSPAPHRDRFPGVLDDVAEPTSTARMRDLLVDRPRRLVRESGRSAAKRAAMSIGGKNGLDRLKTFVAQRGRRAPAAREVAGN
ncbi:putative rhamnosyl transferase [Aldersonia sp. NBC_00410]|uniref:glycosyltransferase n=1 Tax=Aldersonia sp. NBC_00410 TaxID=2975954 RepID=UPI00225188CF|nr:glycosyltransferase [Aldersonia sp. NBC_00410]MCX5041682.1 putative rhamnosyl transferase [Aldersonia sp. NBC_00410]